MSGETAAVQGILEPIVKDVFETMVNCPAAPCSMSAVNGTRITAFVGIGGEKKYTVLLECSESLACRAAGSMLSESFAEWSDSVQDALSEIANMIAGNVKSKLPEHLHLSLSLPTVIRGSNYECNTPKMKLLQESCFQCGEEPLIVRIVEEES